MNNMKETASPMSLKLTMMRRSKDQQKERKPSQKLSINFPKKMSFMNMKGDTILNKLSKELLSGTITENSKIEMDYFKESGLIFKKINS